MKNCALFIATAALLATVPAFTSAGQPPVPGQPPATEPGVIPPAPPAAVDAQAGGTTITVSRTFTNEPGAITLIGTVSSEQEKQAIGAKVQEAAPGKMVNNQLSVGGQEIVEPSGAEPKGKSPSELEGDNSQERDDADVPEQTDRE